MEAPDLDRIYTEFSGKVMGYIRARIRDENLSDNVELDEDLLNQESLSELAAALRRLPQQLMDIIVLRYYDGKPLTEIAEIMNLSYGAVKLRHQNAVIMLREALS